MIGTTPANCRTTLTRLGELLDGSLTPAEEEQLRTHLATCPRCTEFLAAYRALGGIMGRVTAFEPPDDLTTRVLRRLKLGAH
jgi:anti-sigma factor (TIGR02949 family)